MKTSDLYAPIIQNMGVMTNILLSKAIDLGAASEIAVLREVDRELVELLRRKAGFNPNQPRVPAGNHDGGRWTVESMPAQSLSASEKAINFIKKYETFQSYVYPDQAGFYTIGYGHKLLPGETYNSGISKEEAVALLKKDISIAENSIRRNVRVNLTQNQFDALTSFVYNIGAKNFSDSTLLKLLNDGDYDGAAQQFLRWNKVSVNGQYEVSNGLTKRRKEEREIFLGSKKL